LPDAAFEEDGGSSELADLVGEQVHQFGLRVRPTISQGAFEVIPDALVGIQFGGVRREGHQMQTTRAVKQFSDWIATMDSAVVQQHDQMSSNLAQQLTQEANDLFALDVVRIQLAVQRTVEAPWTDRDAGNGRDAVVSFAVANDRRPSDRGPGLADGRDQEEAGFVDEDDVGRQPCGVFFTAGQTDRFHSAMATSSRSMARRSGFWELQPNWCRSLPT